MRTVSATVADVLAAGRLDARFFVERIPLARILEGSKHPLASVRDVFGHERILLPNIFERVPAASEEFGKPILTPYDCFRYLPYSNDFLSSSQVSSYSSLAIQRGWLLIVCSGRNLGPVTLVDRFLERFVISHDMIRLCVPPTDELFYFMAVMHTQIGQALVRRGRNGSVIDHLDAKQIGSLRYPVVNSALKKRCAAAFRKASEWREDARLSLDRLANDFLNCLGLSDFAERLRQTDRLRRFALTSNTLGGRIDSEYYAPRYSAYRRMILETDSAPLGELARIFKPPGRYRTLYVEDPAFGIRILSGRQIAQFRPIGLKLMSRTAWTDPASYVLQKNTVLVTSDGRADENLADCALVRRDRHGWAASGHVHRLMPRSGVHPGLLYLACASKPVQEIFKSLATGSVVDALSVTDLASVRLPYSAGAKAEKLGDAAVAAWDRFADAAVAENDAINALEAELET